jgi:hypothetical protein
VTYTWTPSWSMPCEICEEPIEVGDTFGIFEAECGHDAWAHADCLEDAQ